MEGPEFTYDPTLSESDTSVEADPRRVKALEMISSLMAEFSDVALGVEEGARFADQRTYWKNRHDIELTESVRFIQIEMAINTCLHALLQIRKGIESGTAYADMVADLESKKLRLDEEMQAIIRDPSMAHRPTNPFQIFHPDAFEFIYRGYADMASHLKEIAADFADEERKKQLVQAYVDDKFKTLQNIKSVFKEGMEALDSNLLAYSDDIVIERRQKEDVKPSLN